MPEINLASEVFRARLLARRRGLLYGVAAGLLVLVAASWVLPYALTWQTRNTIEAVQRDIAVIEAKLDRRRDDVHAILQFTRHLTLLKERLEQRLGWSGVLTALEKLAPPTATFKKLDGSVATGLVKAEVLVPTLDVGADLIASLQQAQGVPEKPFTSVEIVRYAQVDVEGGAAGTRPYLLELRLGVNPAAFRVGMRPPAAT